MPTLGVSSPAGATERAGGSVWPAGASCLAVLDRTARPLALPLANVLDVWYNNVVNVKQINEALWRGAVDVPEVFPHLDQLAALPFVFRMGFGLDELPEEPGLLLIRGARQYGKSTWLEGQIRATVQSQGPGTALYLNGDELPDAGALVEAIRTLLPLFVSGGRVKRLFIDEITAIKDWQRGLKRLLDAGELRQVLVVTTGSKAADLRHGSERLPGRKGRLSRTEYLFTPVSYAEFRRVCGERLGDDTLASYLLSGGSPIACGEIAASGRLLPEYVPEIVRDWVLGEFAASGRQRAPLLAVMQCLLSHGGAPLGQAKLAREAGLANNTVAAGYLDLLADLLCIAQAYAWDESHGVPLPRKPSKVHFINLLAAAAWHPARLRSVADFTALPEGEQGIWIEWLVAQELWRRAAIRGDFSPDTMAYWRSKEHELDFVLAPDSFLEVKRGQVTPLEFSWFPRCFAKGHLTVVSASRFETEQIRSVTLEHFLLEGT